MKIKSTYYAKWLLAVLKYWICIIDELNLHILSLTLSLLLLYLVQVELAIIASYSVGIWNTDVSPIPLKMNKKNHLEICENVTVRYCFKADIFTSLRI